MLALLPPSEGKASAPRRGGPLDLASLSFPQLALTRERVLDALVAASTGPDALSVLGLPPGLSDELDKNRALLDAPTRKAGDLYTGVLYDALDLDSLDAAARRRANRSVVVMSALWGAVRLSDRIPSYRLSGAVSLPGVGRPSSVWRDPLEATLPDVVGRGLCIDLRSSTYAAMWRPTGPVARRTVAVRVLHERVPGDPSSRAIVSHFNKATKGEALRSLLESGADPRTPSALVDTLRDLGWTTEVYDGSDGRGPTTVDVVVLNPTAPPGATRR